ncbi:hypothetical protein [Deinococcus multiflagellatus]|uniref:Uncharacterized protein n=1 Tax=Deinococcus multiflagellatus TaxID=1656887 RepID=A0ABW1ZQR5_9DEIO
MHTLTALHQVPLTTGPRTLSLHAPEVAFTAAVALSGGDVCGVQSPVTPSWHTTLRQHGVHPATLVDAQDQARHLGQALAYLQRRGVITAEELAHLAQERLLHALLPLLPYRVEMTIRPSAGRPGTDPRVPVLEGVKALAALQPAGRPVHLSLQQAYAASPAQVVLEDDGTPAALVYRAALQGMTLQEMARRLPLRWDELRRTVLTLTAAGDIWPAEQTRPGRVQPQLQAGELAPDFILPALVGPRCGCPRCGAGASG